MGDCRDPNIFEQIKNRSGDLILADAPYNISSDTVIKRIGGKFGNVKDIVSDHGEWDHDFIQPEEWVPIYLEKLKDKGVFICFYDSKKISELISLLLDCGMTIRHVGGWHKLNPPPQARKVCWQYSLELFVIATRNKGAGHHYNYQEGQHHDVISTTICRGKERLKHPTQKPEALINPLIRWWSFPGDLVIDPFVGAGNTCAVAMKLKRRSIGIELKREYVNMARDRCGLNIKPLKEGYDEENKEKEKL
jgi:DNA modification methylase